LYYECFQVRVYLGVFESLKIRGVNESVGGKSMLEKCNNVVRM